MRAETVHMGHIIISHAGAEANEREKKMQKKEITKLQSNYRWEKTTGRKRQEDNIEGKQENEPNVKRILGIYHKGKLQKEIIKEDY